MENPAKMVKTEYLTVIARMEAKVETGKIRDNQVVMAVTVVTVHLMAVTVAMEVMVRQVAVIAMVMLMEAMEAMEAMLGKVENRVQTAGMMDKGVRMDNY
ncbi:hypothetical protein XBJ2_1700002 [Xenorhabdus bovienii str. Jollieti]|nr:hypothetical protein XBJ2_1700002 [Xenorhabdus bovienii str. Jollieti]